MVISFHGGECFKVSFGDITLAFNPISKLSKNLKPVRFGADIALVSLHHGDMNGIEEVSYGDRKAFVVEGPGEYEIKGVTIRGFPSKTSYGGVARVNTIFFVELEGMKLCFLGALLERKLSPEILEVLDDIDILFLPVGGDGVLEPGDAHELSVELEPKVIIPMHYGDVGQKNALAAFLKEEGEDVKPVEKLTVKKKDLEGKEGEVVVLSV